MSPQQKKEIVPEPVTAIHASGSAVVDLQRAVHEGLERRAGQKFEVGGFLLGPGSGPVRIEAIHPMPIEHRFGPSFWLSSADVMKWRQTIAQLSENGTSRIIGHFRSQRSDGSPLHEVAPQDVDHAIADLLGISDPLLILVPLSTDDMDEVHIYRRSQGLWKEHLRSPIEGLLPLPVTPPRPAPAVVPIDSARRPRSWFPILTSAAALLLLLLAWIAWRRPILPSGAAGPIGFTAHATTGGIALAWNRNSAVVLQSVSGTLTIHDGDNRQQLTLNHSQLLDGGAVYVPKSGQVDFRLELYRDASHFTGESLSVATGVTTPPAATQAAAPPVLAPPVRVVQQPLRSGGAAADRTSALPSAPQPVQTPAVRAEFHEVAPPKRPVEAPADIALPPVLAASPANTAAVGDAQRLLSQPVHVPPPPPVQTNPVTSIEFVAPIPARKVNPSISVETRSLLERTMGFDKLSLEIKVDIDPSGAVSSASPVGALNAPQRLLAPSAIQAARLWRFEPARRNGKAVASDYVITFVFSRH